MIKFLISCAFVAVAYSPLTLADQITSKAKSNEDIQKYMAFEGNTTLQKLVSATYGVTINELLDFFSHKNDNDTDESGPYYNSTAPEWLPKLIVYLVNEKIQKSNKTLKLTPETFVDDGKWYLEFSSKIESMTLGDELSCHFVNNRNHSTTANPTIYIERGKRTDNFTFWMLRPLFWYLNGTSMYCKREFHINGTKHEVYSKTIPIVFHTVVEEPAKTSYPWVWPNASVINYDKPILVKLDCWSWTLINHTMTWYLIKGNNKKEIATKMQKYTQGYIKLEFSKMFDSSDNGSVIVCEETSDPIRKNPLGPPQKITLLYNVPIDAISDECKHLAMLGWGMLALLALSAGLALATYIVLKTIEPDKKKPQT